MTDSVRQLLRAERVSRRLTHPHASYTKEGKLLCNLCETLVKSETQWQNHLHSTQHLLRSQRAKEAADVKSNGAKKRKAESPALEEEVDERKRPRASETRVGTNGADSAVSTSITSASGTIQRSADETSTQLGAAPSAPGVPVVVADAEADADAAELAAFEQELASLEQASTLANTAHIAPNSALNAAATISAAPMTTEELVAQAREDQSGQRGKRDAELEAEKEDAARLLEEEFEEMEGLEERVRRLRERREALRRPQDAARAGHRVREDVDAASVEVSQTEVVQDDDDGDDDDYDDDANDWVFGGT